MSWHKGARVFFGGSLCFEAGFSSQRGCSGVSGCAQGPGAGQPGLACTNRLRLLTIRDATAAPGGERNAFVSLVHLAARRDCWKAKRALNEPRPSIIIKARPKKSKLLSACPHDGQDAALSRHQAGARDDPWALCPGTGCGCGPGLPVSPWALAPAGLIYR